MALGSVSLNMVWNPAIRGSNFLQASVKGIHTYAQKVTKANLLQSTKFSLLNRNIKQLDNHLGNIRSKTAKISANPIRLDIKTSRNSLKMARKDMTAIEHDAKQVAFWTKKSADNLKRGARVKRASIKNNPQIGTGAMVGAIGAVGVMTLPFKASIDFESNMADVKALTKNITSADFEALTQKARILGATTEWSASQSALGMTYLAKAGFDAKQQLGAMGGVLGLATAGSVDLGVASNISSNILSSFSIRAEKMGIVSDVLAKTFSTSNTDLLMLGETMEYTAPIASGLGVGLSEVSALAGKLGDVGIQGSMAGTSLRQMYTRLSAPPVQAQKALHDLGVSVFDAKGKFKGMPNIIGELNQSMVGMSDEVRSKKLKHIFGMTALSSGIALLKVGKKGLLDYKATLDNSGGTTKNIQTIKLDTTKGHFKLLSSAMEGLSISATTGLLPVIKLVSNGFKSGAETLDRFTQKFPNASKWIFGLGTAFVIGSVALATFGFIASGVATAIGFISLPVLAVVAGVTALASAGYFLYTRFEGVRTVVSGLGATLGSLFGGISDVMLPVAGAFASAFMGIGSSIMQIVRPIGSLLMGIGGLLGGFKMLGVIAKGVGWIIGSVFTVVTAPILGVIKLIQGALGAVGWLAETVGSLFGFGSDDKKGGALKPANNINYKTAGVTVQDKKLPTLSLKEAQLQTLPLESVSDVTANQINETKSFMQNCNSNKAVTQNINNNIIVQSTDGKIDEDDLYEKLMRVNKRIAHDEQDLQFADVS